jgi:hypothetical protein
MTQALAATFKEIVWRIHVRANHEASTRRLFQRVVTQLGHPAEERGVERYWKIPEQFVLHFTTPLEATTAAEAVFQTMLTAQRIGTGWGVSGPSGYDDGSWTFEMSCAANAHGHFGVAGVEFAHVSLRSVVDQA